MSDSNSAMVRVVAAGLVIGFCVMSDIRPANCQEVKDLKYGVVLFEFYQQKYFETLVEYAYANERGGIHNHGDYPELLKGGVSLSYGLDLQARDIFSKLIAGNATKEVQNRAWFYLAKMLYLRGEVENARTTMGNIHDAVPRDIDQEYRYLAALINIKQGYFDEAEAISDSFDKHSSYAPYLYFNLGVALGKQQDYTHAITNLKKAASYAGDGSLPERLADRAHMAIAYLDAENEKFTDAYAQINHVSTSGVFSNRALLGSGWAYVNNGSYSDALAPLTVLEQRSMAIPEVQEAVLLVPHVYEKLGLMGRAANGFISAYDRYEVTLKQLDSAKKSLKHADILELFVRNMDEMLGESDWFGTAPSVSLNSLSPFLLEVMSDHSFQSVLKDLRDLYAIRNNLNSWKRKRDDFDVILKSRSVSLDTAARRKNVRTYSLQQSELQDAYTGLVQRVAGLDKEEQERVQWQLSDLEFDIGCAGMMAAQLQDAPGIPMNTEGYAKLVKINMDLLDKELVRTNKLITRVENVLRKLINAELDIHEARLKYYQVQSQLAKVRILDKSLGDLDGHAAVDQNGEKTRLAPVQPASKHKAEARGNDDAA